MLQIQSKRFYLDVKQNKRGKFIKVEKRLSLLASSARNSAQGLNLILRWLRSAQMDDGLKSSWRYPLQVEKLEIYIWIGSRPAW